MQPVMTPFGFESTSDDVIRGVDLSGKRAVVTGATSGLGVETARALAAAGAEVVLGVRRLDAGRKVAEELRGTTGNDAIEAAPLDLSDLASVASFAQAWNGPLHILVNNAGVMALPELKRSALGCEMQFASNFLGHFALVVALRGPLASAGGARVVSVSSTGHLFSPVVFDDLHYRFRPYDPMTAYGQSKTATVLLAVEVTARWASDGIIANALNPGAIATGLQKHTGGLRTPEEFRKTVQQGASTSVLLAASPLVDGIGGRYFENNNEAEVVAERAEDLGRAGGVANYALDGDNAARLWREATALTQL
ncbi:SDR family NAD(P)-dependent oxidoreductase [Mycolicibacterium sp. KC 300]|uniref:SDR family NAD(P)-dependent oxidoreductase n=1 Tax=Mycolicibacterium arseniciresistens TaxID=3062257 RepID=A0ABT8UE40_9MYCO|nr:SDR family NAD(P)-dependent oxidoreductase [Mycolicibacterium arseniciresistens]